METRRIIMNNFCITGRLTADPVLRMTQAGKAVTSYRVAVNRSYSREGDPTADFFQVTAFGKAAEFVKRYFSKGQMIAVSGELRLDEYTTQSGEKRMQPTIYANTQDFCGDGKNKQAGTQQASKPTSVPADDFMPVDAPAGGDDDLPF